MVTSLHSLPVELVCQIVDYLDIPDISNLRLVCRDLHSKTFDTFAKQFFTMKQFMLSRFSLQALTDISQHKTLSPYMQRIIIGTDYVSDPANKRDHEYSEKASSNIDVIRLKRAHSRFFAEQEYMWNLGVHARMLSAALKGFRNCHTIEIRDYNCRRARDGKEWRSYGAHKIKAETGFFPLRTGPESRDEPIATQMFTAVVSAAVAAGFPLNSLLVTFLNGPVWDRDGMLPHAFYIPPDLAVEYEAVLEQLDTLTLAVRTQADEVPFTLELCSFLCLACNLTSLRLNLQGRFGGDYFIESLDPIVLPSITRLELGYCLVAEEILICLVKRFRSMLRHLGLFRIQLVGSWKKFAAAVAETSKAADFAMRSIKLDTLRQASEYLVRAMDKVGFKPADDADVCGYDDLDRSLAYEGPDMTGFLAGLEERLVVADDEWYSTMLGNGFSSESSDDADDDDDDDDDDEEIPLDDAEVEDDEEEDGGDDDGGTPVF